MKRRARWRAVAAACLVTLATAVPSADAFDAMFPTVYTSPFCFPGSMGSGTFCRTDNAAFTAYVQSTPAGMAYVPNTVLDTTFNNTDLNVSHPATPVYTGANETDLIIHNGAISGDTVGTTWCDATVSSNNQLCDQEYVRVETAYWNSHVFCHEIGHSVGLTHGNQADPNQPISSPDLGCMRTDGNQSTSLSTLVNQINAAY
jgi:hypothetical protein